MEFGATYPFEETTPYASSSIKLGRTKGSFGKALTGMSREKKFENLPRYAQTKEKQFPSWKRNYIRRNREFFQRYERKLAPIMKEIENLNVPSWQKFEWNVQGGKRDLTKYIIQFRGSGVRVKKTNFFPSLVTVSTQIPILGWEYRYITPTEGARIQSMSEIELPENIGACFSALGNAVNAHIVKLIATNLIIEKTKDTTGGEHSFINSNNSRLIGKPIKNLNYATAK